MAKKPHGGFAKKKEGKENVVITSVQPQIQTPMDFVPYYPYLYISAA